MQTQVEELPDNRVRLEVEVPGEDVKHAVEHAASDLATSLRVPGFRKGKVPLPVLIARVGHDRLMSDAIASHIGGWFWNAAERARIRPVARPEYGYELPSSAAAPFRFTATVDVQPTPEVGDWTALEVGYAEPEVPAEAVDEELDALRSSVAELVPVEGRPVAATDTLVVDLVGPSGDGERDYVVELGQGRLLEEIEAGLVGMRAGESKEIEVELAGEESSRVIASVKEIKEKTLPPLDDDLARAASEFDTLDELRGDIESRLHDALADEAEADFRAAAVDQLVEASQIDAEGPLVEARTTELLETLARSLSRRGIPLDTYLTITGGTVDELRERLRAEARQSVARELALEAVAKQLGLEISDGEVETLIREQAQLTGDDADEAVSAIWRAGRHERLREDLRLRAALDRLTADVKRIPAEQAAAREKLWTPDKERQPAETKLWTPSSKERT